MVCLTEGRFAGWSGGPPFTDSTPDQASGCAVCAVGVGVAGWNTSAACSERVPVLVAGVLDTLLGPEETPAWCFLGGPFLAWPV
jgi:hypothetical protein